MEIKQNIPEPMDQKKKIKREIKKYLETKVKTQYTRTYGLQQK